MDTAMLLATGLLHAQRDRDALEPADAGPWRVAGRLASALAVLIAGAAALDLAMGPAAVRPDLVTGECHACIAELDAAHGRAHLARPDAP